jgi:RNase adaptor protein for sRNA GlmZ degradation
MTDLKTKILTVELFSFSYKKPLPAALFSSDEGRHGGGFVFDCRCLPNPGREERYKTKTGIDLEVIEYLTQSVEVQRFRELTFNLVSAAIQNYLSRDFEFLSVGYGCTGGQHRSVFFAQQLSEYLLKSFAPRVETRVVHSNLAAIQSALNR